MVTAKKEIEKLLAEQPDDVSHEELIRELAFDLMVSRGLKDSKKGTTISNDEMGNRIKQWQE